MDKIRFGIIGAGAIAQARMIPAMLESKYSVPAAVMNTKIEKAREICGKFGIEKAYDSVEALLNDSDIDAVYIPTPVYTHTDLVKKAADAGKHIICEKPLGMDAEDALSAVNYCKSRGAKFTVDFMMRYGTHINNIRRMIAAGEIGQLVSGNARFSCWTPDTPGYWLHDMKKAGGGPIMDMGIHLIDLIRYITGMEVTRVAALQERITLAGDDNTTDDSSTLIMRMENGAQFVVQTNFNIPDTVSKWTIDFYGTRGRLMGDTVIGQVDGGILNALTLKDGDNLFDEPQAGFGPGKNVEAAFGNMYVEMVDRFCLAIINDTEPEVDPMEAVKDQLVIDAAYRSSRTGVIVNLNQ